MTSLAFLRSEEVQHLLARAAKAAGTPVAIHYFEGAEEGVRPSSWGGCATCRHISASPAGRAACREARLPAALRALRQQRTVPFLCHMGFTCLVAPAVPEDSFVLVFGPFCPASDAPALETDVRAGLEALNLPVEEVLPFSLDDVHLAPRGAMAAVVAWTTETLVAWWREQQAAETADEAITPVEAAPEAAGARQFSKHQPQPYRAHEIAAALAGKDQPQARALLRSVLEEGRSSIEAQRVRARTAVVAVMEVAERAGMTRAAEDRLPEFLETLPGAESTSAILDAAFQVLGVLRRTPPAFHRKSGNIVPATARFPELHRIIMERLLDGITLEEAAAQLGETATNISHRLRRKFGMSYSEYVGRLRIERAKVLLRKSKLSATEVAMRVGISDQSNFSKLFRKFEGTSPLEYRKRYGKK